MSIASEITRLQSAKADLKTAIEGKGVTVPSATTLDGYADLVDNIPSGGGGTYPWTSSVETVTIGANSVTNMGQAKDYFSSYQPYYLIALKTAPDTNNQAVAFCVNGGNGLRYRNGAVSTSGIATAYDGKLIEGTQYDVYHF